ncbi:2OG-Fe(II) oxygenase [Mangrovimicrobium sediminis]|uniref:2OG-Fe(II) oxygenase n=1 Tax=Mangrovimicrobium sediminis TaxID=2562682 RepID=A0A4Z0M564_9GAMM|nr:2OG-Fe(II) oxygenase [Haliea sp. SAOS-164]TGD74792.1 2OG-Fe(II) oxygenase [Haliea sp. SAOS-164]
MRTELQQYVRVYPNALDREFCENMIAAFEGHPERLQTNGKSESSGLAQSSWVELDVGKHLPQPVAKHFIDNALRHKRLYERECQIEPPLPETGRYAQLIMKRYAAAGGDGFQPHYDSLGPVSNRFLVFLWYLNDVERGGETDFMDLGVKVPPRQGTMVIFPPYWMYRHRGCVPESGDKYILSTYALW